LLIKTLTQKIKIIQSSSLLFTTWNCLFLLFSGNVELEEADITIIDDVFFTLLSKFTLILAFLFRTGFDEIFVFHDFSADETFFEISVDDTSSVGGLGTLSDSPASDFIFSCSEEVDQFQDLITSLDDLVHHAGGVGLDFVFLVFSLVFLAVHSDLFVINRVGKDGATTVVVDPFLDLGEPLVALSLRKKF